tara:strand:- start:13304 stop:13960 length:657 start_codon:yes stop_codon:yes gene_type:complete
MKTELAEFFNSEEQSEETLKRLWKEYGVTLIISIIASMALYLGFKSYQEHDLKEKEDASNRYNETLALKDKPEDFILAVEKFDTEVNHKAYSSLLHLMVAKIHVDHQRYEEAKQMLQQLIGNSDSILSQTAQVRLARIQFYLKEYEAALTTLGQVKSPSFIAASEALKGDIYLNQGQIEAARKAYSAAIEQSKTFKNKAADPVDPLLQMKLDDLTRTQ